MSTPFTFPTPKKPDVEKDEGDVSPFTRPMPLPAPVESARVRPTSPIAIGARPSAAGLDDSRAPARPPQSPAVAAAPSAFQSAPPPGSSRAVLDAPDAGVRSAMLARSMGQSLSPKQVRRLAVRAQVEESTVAGGGRIAGGRGIAVEAPATDATSTSAFQRAEPRYGGASIGDITGDTQRRLDQEDAARREAVRVAEREADRVDREGYRAATLAGREASAASTEARKAADAAQIEDYERTGRKYRRLPDGRILAATNPDGSPAFEPVTGLPVQDTKTGWWLEDRDVRGETRRRRPSVEANEDGSLVWSVGPSRKEPAGHFLDAMKSDDPELSKKAKSEYGARLKKLRDAALRPLYKDIDAASIELESGKAELAEMPRRIEALNTKLSAAEKAGDIEFGGGGVMGKVRGEASKWRAKTEAGQAVVEELEALRAREGQLRSDTLDDWKSPPGRLAKAKLGAIAQRNVARDLLRGGSVDDMLQARRDYVERTGGDPEKDPVIAEITKAAAKLGFRAEGGKEGPGVSVGRGEDGQLRVTGPAAFGPRDWSEANAEDGGGDPAMPADAEEPEGEPDALGAVMRQQGFEFPSYRPGDEIGGRRLSTAEATALSDGVPDAMRALFRGEALDNLSQYRPERARGLFGNGRTIAERAILAKLAAAKEAGK